MGSQKGLLSHHRPHTCRVHPSLSSNTRAYPAKALIYGFVEGYHTCRLGQLLIVLDVKARRDGGVAERLHTSCRHVLAVLEIQGGERTKAAQSLQCLVRDLGVPEV
jgi:hypothetical protein